MNKKQHSIHIKLAGIYKPLFMAGFILFLSALLLLNGAPPKVDFIATPIDKFIEQFQKTGNNYTHIFNY